LARFNPSLNFWSPLPAIDATPRMEGTVNRPHGAPFERRVMACRGGAMTESFDLDRFLEAQNPVFDEVRAELRAGRKTTHWMWFVFPQLAGLGYSWMSRKYAVSSRAEAEAYLAHPILGPRLIECTQLVNQVEGRSIEEIFGFVDAQKFRSSMTLFAQVAGDISVFADALRKYFNGQPDTLTIDKL
jgi:uncharacterized protein (DUF1810 family)